MQLFTKLTVLGGLLTTCCEMTITHIDPNAPVVPQVE